MIFEPKWKSLMANTVGPLFTPQQCQDIIKWVISKNLKKPSRT